MNINAGTLIDPDQGVFQQYPYYYDAGNESIIGEF